MSTWVASDLHGNYELWDKIKKFLKADDRLIFLGDAIDRGSRGFEILKEMLEDKRILFLRGNHEQAMYDALIDNGHLAFTSDFTYWLKEGGNTTYNNMNRLDWSYRKKLELILAIQNLPFQVKYKSKVNGITFILSHAGYTPNNIFYSSECKKRQNLLLWGREHITDKWPETEKLNSTVIVHGHTPIGYLKACKANEPVWYCNSHKVDVDMGTPTTGIISLLNLDSLKYVLIKASPDYMWE